MWQRRVILIGVLLAFLCAVVSDVFAGEDWKLRALQAEAEVSRLEAKVENLEQTIAFYSQYIGVLNTQRENAASRSAEEELRKYQDGLKEKAESMVGKEVEK